MEFVCPKCNFKIKTSRIKHVNSCNGFGPRKRNKNPTKRGSKEWKEAISIGNKLKWQDDECKLKHKQSIYKAISKDKNWGRGRTNEKELIRKQKLRDIINNRYANGWESKAGRCKKINYESPIAGNVKLDGSWELKVAQYFDLKKIKWTRNKKRFEYINLKNIKSTYCPDFYIEDWNTYLEVKGYKTNLDECKWKQFNDNLIIWDKKKLKELGIL